MTDLPVVLYVPLRRRNGSVCAWAKVDAADAARVLTHRWSQNPRGYAYRTVRRAGRHSSLLMHRVVLGLDFGDRREGDHRNRDPLDNRRANLRVATHGQNHQNRGAMSHSSSRYRGVCWDTARRAWRAFATLDGRVRHIGRFPTEEEAAAAAGAWRSEHMPFSVEEGG